MKKLMAYLTSEIDVMAAIDHPNLLSLVDAKKTSRNIYMFFEFCNGGDVRNLLKVKGGKFSEKIVKEITK